jgi:Flp pilus assembly pilin Flp
MCGVELGLESQEELRIVAVWLNAHLILLLGQIGPPGRRAQSMVEYSIIAALIAIVALAAVTRLGGDIAGVFDRIGTQVSGLGSSGGTP